LKNTSNINLTKSILRKNKIEDTNEDYLKILELTEKSPGWTGYLVKLRFELKIDISEVEDIYKLLSENKVDLGKVFKMDYFELSNYLYDLNNQVLEKNYEFLFSDSNYIYFKINTYNGILETGSPAWCIKTKKYWKEYITDLNATQYVVIKKGKKLLTPNTNYLSKYSNSFGDLRFGITLWEENGERMYKSYDDNNRRTNIENNKTFESVFSKLKHYLLTGEIPKFNLKPVTGLDLIFTDNKKFNVYFLKDFNDVLNFNNKLPLVSSVFSNYNSKETLRNISISEKILMLGFYGKTKSGEYAKQIITFTDWKTYIFDYEGIFHGYKNDNFTRKGLLLSAFEVAYIKYYDKGKEREKRRPLITLPMAVAIGKTSFERITKLNDDIKDDDKYMYRSYIDTSNYFTILRIDKKLGKSADNFQLISVNKNKKVNLSINSMNKLSNKNEEELLFKIEELYPEEFKKYQEENKSFFQKIKDIF
jgi:hypothetical protein